MNDQTRMTNPASKSDSRHSDSVIDSSFLAHWILILGTFLAMLAWSWGTWPDPIIDFGRELYVPWRITQGDILYRDIVSYFNGPFSPYLHALLFKMFGASLQTLVLFNSLILLGLVILLHQLIRGAFGILAATVCCVSFLILFAFAQITPYGNYNFICPYSYELTHGITLTAAAIACLNQWHSKQHRGWLAGAGLLLGLVFLTKAEIFAAAAVGLGIGFVAEQWIRRNQLRGIARDGGIFVGSVILPVIAALLLLKINLTWSQALRGIAGAWYWIGDRQLLEMPYFKELAGTLDPGASIAVMLKWTGAYLIVFGLPALVAPSIRKNPKLTQPIAVVFFILWLGVGFWNWKEIQWPDFVRPLPLALLIAGIVGAVLILRGRSKEILPLTLIVWSLVMLAKIRLNAHIYHYGFALAMPGTIVLIALLIGRRNAALQAAVLAALIVAIWAHANRFNGWWSQKQVVVGQGNDQFLADPRGRIVNEAIAALNKLAAPSATLDVFPEGQMINYLARRTNSTTQGNFTPPALIMFGEETMLGEFQQHPPDFVMIAGIETGEYGARSFGIDYAQKLSAWIHDNYVELETFGPRPFRERGFGIVLMKKK